MKAMKVIRAMVVLIVLIATAAALSGCDGITDPNSYPLEQPTHEYELDTWGYNSEVYEFTPKSNPNYGCVMLMLDSGKDATLQCFPKPNKAEETQS